jgi:hypothetical protein
MNPLANIIVAVLRALLLRQCNVCQRQNLPTNPDVGDWTIQIQTDSKILLGVKCPDCQTPEESVDVVIDQTTGPRRHWEGLRWVEDDGQAQAS